MTKKFEVEFLDEALSFLKEQDEKTQDKIIYNVRKAQVQNDPKLLKKLNMNIWEFRTKYSGSQYRLLAFWDKTRSQRTLVLATHGFVKKTDKVNKKEIEKAEFLRKQYFNDKHSEK